MLRLFASAAALALALGMTAAPASARPVPLTDAQLGAIAAGTNFEITNRISDQQGVAPLKDDLLKNAWGLSQGPGTFLWVANNGTDTSTFYTPDTFQPNGVLGGGVSLFVNVPGAPTGTTFIGSGFNVSNSAGTVSAPTLFAFDTEGGQIEGWAPSVDLHNAVVAVDESSQGSIFKGLTLGQNTAGQTFLYAADFGHGVVKMYDTHYTLMGSFTDPNLPAGYSPFNVQNLNGLIYVTFAKSSGGVDEVDGQGLGIVDVFSGDGVLVRRVAQHGQLNAPWGLAIAPASFGKFAGALLVGNFGDGTINAYDPVTGHFLGTLRGADDKPLFIDGLWALRTGANGTITFSSGPEDESHGLVGSISAGGPLSFGADEVASFAEMHHAH